MIKPCAWSADMQKLVMFLGKHFLRVAEPIIMPSKQTLSGKPARLISFMEIITAPRSLGEESFVHITAFFQQHLLLKKAKKTADYPITSAVRQRSTVAVIPTAQPALFMGTEGDS